MDCLARALVSAAAFLELSDDDVVNPDAAIRALEDITANLARASEGELTALRHAVEAETLARTQRGASERELAFFRSFMASLGRAT